MTQTSHQGQTKWVTDALLVICTLHLYYRPSGHDPVFGPSKSPLTGSGMVGDGMATIRPEHDSRGCVSFRSATSWPPCQSGRHYNHWHESHEKQSSANGCSDSAFDRVHDCRRSILDRHPRAGSANSAVWILG